MSKSITIIFLFIIVNILALILLGGSYALIFIPVNLSILLLLKIYILSSKYGSTIFHPLPIICIILILSFVLAPIVSLGFNVFLFAPPRVINWDKWLVVLSWLYFVGIIFFYIGVKISFRAIYNSTYIDIQINKKKLVTISVFFLLLTLVSQLFIFYKYGGFLSYLTKWNDSSENFEGLGIWYMIAEPFPIIFLIFAILFLGRDKFNKNIRNIVLLFILFFMLKIFFGGLRGSRSNTIWGLFWFAGIVHLYLFRLGKFHIMAGVLFLAIFMSTYSIYKTYGIDSFSGEYALDDTNRFEKNPLIEIYLGDFSRGTINAYQIAQISDFEEFDFKYGQTYLSSFSKIIPPLNGIYTGHTKDSAGAEIVSNIKVNPQQDNIHNSRVFGAYGEAILNFGIYWGLISFFFFGVIVTILDNVTRKYLSKNVFIMLIPFISNFSFAISTSDSDNLIFFAFKNGFIVFLYIFMIHKTCNVKYYSQKKY